MNKPRQYTNAQRKYAAAMVKAAFPEFEKFAEYMAKLHIPGFKKLTKMQRRMCRFLQYGPRVRMVGAQRGEGKTYITGWYVNWRHIQDGSEAILVVSSVQKMADDIGRLIINNIRYTPILHYMLPAGSKGAADGANQFDLHPVLKGHQKDHSVVTVPIGGTLPGRRPSIIIADDIESNKNSETAVKRETLVRSTLEFSRMNVEGDIIYLGTMQNKDSVYTGLPARGVTVRLMPGRYPALGEDKYGPLLDPDIRAEMEADPSLRTGGGLLGNLGKPTDPERYDEEALREKELDNGPEGFALHYLLDTSLSDALKFQLKTRDLMLLDCPQDRIPLDIVWIGNQEHQVTLDASLGLQAAYIQEAFIIDGFGFEPPKGIWCAIDPAGQGGDETVLIAGCAIGRTIHILDMDAFRGGLGDDSEARILHFFRRNKVEFIYVEKNMGHGLFGLGLRNMLQGSDQEHLIPCITEEYSTGQKERRIIETLRPLMERHRICIHRRVLDQDMKLLLVYGIQERRVFSLMYQLTNITVDRGSLLHDDRLDALAMLVSRLAPAVMNDPLKQVEEAEEAKVRDWLENPLGMPWIEHQTPQQHQPMEWDW